MGVRKRVLVTGGAGFLGSHLCDRLIKDGHEVVCLDNLMTGSEQNVEHLKNHPAFSFIKQNVQQPFSMQVDWIFNLACPASPVHYHSDPVETVRTNVLGMMNMLDLARSTGARILQASTSEVYGDPLEHPQKETYWGNVNPISRRACYDEGKRCAETLCFDYHREFGVDIRVIRIFNTYGPRMAKDDGRVVSTFILQALRSEDITIYGTGTQTRSFQYVDDLIEGMMRMMSQDGFVGPINIGNPGEFTMDELAELVMQMTGTVSRTNYIPGPRVYSEYDIQKRKPDIALAKEMLGWEPHVPLRQGLEKTIAYFKRVL